MTVLHHYYQSAVAQKKILNDPAQFEAITRLDELLATLLKPETEKRFSLFRKKEITKGLYVYGPVGRGKTMLMDWFLTEAKNNNLKIERWHFHAFMLEIHRSLRDLKEEDVDNRVAKLGDKWAKRLKILCFDEFHVTDVADAMIMMPLFTRLFENGVIIITTSNWAPDDLYSGGLQRARFVPFIDIIKQHMNVIDVSGNQDYRQLKQKNLQSWLTPLNNDTEEQFDIQFRDAAGYDPIETHEIHIGSKEQGRTWVISRASKNTAWLDLAKILNEALGAADFLALAARYQLLFLDNLEPFTAENNDKAKRFMVMIDALYDAGTKLAVRAETEPARLYPGDGKLNFEFSRTLSRLNEMISSKEV